MAIFALTFVGPTLGGAGLLGGGALAWGGRRRTLSIWTGFGFVGLVFLDLGRWAGAAAATASVGFVVVLELSILSQHGGAVQGVRPSALGTTVSRVTASAAHRQVVSQSSDLQWGNLELVNNGNFVNLGTCFMAE